MGKKRFSYNWSRLYRFFVVASLLFIIPGISPAVSRDDSSSDSSFRVLDIAERTFNGGPAVAVLLSAPLDPARRHDSHLRISAGGGFLKSAWVLSEDNRTLYYPHVEPETEYSVVVMETLTSADGETPADRVADTVTTRKIIPVVSFAGEGLLLPPDLTGGLPVVTVNIPEVHIDFFRMVDTALSGFVDWGNLTGRKDYWQLGRMAEEQGDFVYSGVFELTPPKNRRTVRHIPVETLEPLKTPGLYLAVMRKPGEYAYNYHATYFIVTDVALHARVYEDRSLIFASSLKTGAPLSGVTLDFMDNKGRVVRTETTDENGVCRVDGRIHKTYRLIKAAYENHMGVLPLNIPSLDFSEFDLGGRSYRPREVFLYSPRDLYRPGETAVFCALLRDFDAKPVKAIPLRADFVSPDGKTAKTVTWHPEPLEEEDTNYYQTAFTVPAGAPTGRWLLRVFTDPGATTSANSYAFHVEEFLPERMKLDLTAEPEVLGPGEDLTVSVQGVYLYGAPAAGNRIDGRVRVAAKRELFDSLKDFEFGDADDGTYKDFWAIEESKLDAQGEGKITVENRWREVKSPLEVRTVVSLYESGGRPVVRGISRTMWPAGALVGIRPLFDPRSVDAGPIRFEVVKAGPDGTLLPASDLMVDLTKEDRDYYWEYSDQEGWRYRYTQKNYQYLADNLSLAGDSPTPYTMHLPYGRYLLIVTDPETQLKTSIRFRVGYYGYDEDRRGAARPDKVLLQTDKPAYRVGDLIRLTVKPPHSGEALILVEGETPLWKTRLPVSAEGTEVTIPVAAGWKSHDLYISAVVFRPANAREKITPTRSVGLIHLKLDRTRRQLPLTVTAPDTAVPEKPMTVRLRAETQNGETAFVTLAAVDVGILNITDFKTPDPFAWFFEPRRFGVITYDMYGKVIEAMDGEVAPLKYGGDADIVGGKRPETKVKLVSLFSGPVSFNNTGEAEITLDLPDFNGRLRLMAVAFSPERFGAAETETTVRAPVVTQLSMPRFLAPGDKAFFTLDVHNLSGRDLMPAVDLTAEEPLVVGDTHRAAALAHEEKTTLTFPVYAVEDFGGAPVHMSLTAEGVDLTRHWQLGVRPGYPGIVRESRQALKTGETFAVPPDIIADMIPSTVEVSVTVSPVLPLNVRHSMRGLIGYPYGCLEQTTSRGFPILFLTPEAVETFRLPELTQAERVKRVDKTVSRISTMQLASGGFGLWNRSSPETPWLTVYATDFLLTAREKGYSVPETMLNAALKRLTQYVKSEPPIPDYYHGGHFEHLTFAAKSYAGYVLSKVKRAPLADLRILYDNHHEKADASLPLVHAGLALLKMGDAKRGKAALVKASAKRGPKYGYWGDYGSRVRNLGELIALMLENDAVVDGFDRLLVDLEAELRERRWLSTQEKFALFRAGLFLRSFSDKAWQGYLAKGETSEMLDHKGALRMRPTMEEVAAGIRFTSNADGYLFASVHVSGYTKTPPPPEDEKITIRRELYDTKGVLAETSEFNVGDLLVVRLWVKSEEWIPDALVADLLPAGFELENPNLIHSIKLDDISISGKRVWKYRENTLILAEEYRDDRYVAAVSLNKHRPVNLFYLARVVTPGTFSVPPPYVESMYRPMLRGIGPAGDRITVHNKP